MTRNIMFYQMASVVLSLAIIAPAVAVDVSLTATDALGASSYNTAGNWSNAAVPSAGNDYFVSLKWLRSPEASGDFVFGGDALTLQTGGAILSKNIGAQTLSQNLILDGGYVRSGAGAADTLTLAGTIAITNNDGGLIPDQSPFVVTADITGSGTLFVGNSDAINGFGGGSGPGRGIDFAGASTLTGDVVADAADMVWTDTSSWTFNIGASGVNNQIAGTGAATFNGLFNFDLSAASSNPGDSWTITDVTTQTYGETFSVGGGFSPSGSFWSNGTYLFDPGTGVLSVAAVPVEWGVDIDNGLFSNDANWAGGDAPGAGDNALFGGIITANRTVLLDTNIALNRVTFSNADGDYFLAPQTSETLTLTGEAAVNVALGRHWLQVQVAGSEGLQKEGSGELILDHANLFTGGITIGDGRLSVTHPNAIPSGQNIELAATSSNLLFGGDNGFFVENGATGGGYLGGTVNGVISGAGSVVVTLCATPTFSGANTFTGPLTVEGTDSVLTVSGAGTLGASDGTAATQTRISGTAQVALAGKAIGDEFLFLDERADEGTPAHLSSSGTSSWAGNIKAETPGVGSHYKIESTSGTLTLSGIISAFDAAAPNDRNFVFDGAGNINVTGRITDFATDANGDFLDVDMNGTPDASAGNNVNVIKRGTGTLTISTATGNTYDYHQGFTIVEQGTLRVQGNGATLGELLSNEITVRSGANLTLANFTAYSQQPEQTFGGGGAINTGGATLNLFGDGNLNPGDGVGTLTINGNTSLDRSFGGGVLRYELGNTTTVGGTENDLVQINGTLSTTAGTQAMTVQVTPVEGTLASGSYRLVNHTSGGAANVTGIGVNVVNNLGEVLNPRQTFSITSTTGQVNLQVVGSSSNLTWAGTAGNSTWDVATSTNWSGSNQFRDLDHVTFGSGGTKAVILNSNVTPGSTTFNSANTYTFTGTGGITGSGPVNVNAGTVSFQNSGSNYTGATTVASGARLEMAGGSTGAMTVNGSLALGREFTTTVIDDFSGGLGSYTNTVILDTDFPGGANAAAWQITDGAAEYNTSAYQSIEQAALIRSGLSLAVGEELQVDLTHSGASQDIGLYVGGTAPIPVSGADNDTRQDYISVYARGSGGVFSRGFDGTGELGLLGGVAAYDKLFIARTGANTYEAGYYDDTSRNVIATRTPATPNDGEVVGFYTDVRGAGVLGSLDNLSVASGGAGTLTIDGDFSLGGSGTLEIDISGNGADMLDINGIASLAGEIAVSLAGDFTPADGAQYTILSAAGGIATALGSLDFGSGLPDGFTAMYNDDMTDLILTFAAGLDGDFNGDGSVNLADYTVWRDHLGATEGDLLAGNGDGGTVGPSDYLLWKTNFGIGAAATGQLLTTSANVPEPSSVVLLTSFVAGIALRRRGTGPPITV